MLEIVSKTNNLYDVLDTDDGVIESSTKEHESYLVCLAERYLCVSASV